jgi:hypothetical protein
MFRPKKYDPLFSVRSDAWIDQDALNAFLTKFGVPKQTRLQAMQLVRFSLVIRTHLLTVGPSSPDLVKNTAVVVYYSSRDQAETHVLSVSVARGFDADRSQCIQRLLSLALRERPTSIYHGKLSALLLASGIKRLPFGKNETLYGWNLTDPEQFAWMEAKISEFQKENIPKTPRYYCKKTKLTREQRREMGFFAEEATTENCMQQGFGGGLRHMKTHAI